MRRDPRRIPPPDEVLASFRRNGTIKPDCGWAHDPRSCTHHDEGKRTLARHGDVWACWQCCKWWWARGQTGLRLFAPRLCPVCGDGIGNTEILCKPHWFSVPQKLRTEVWRAFRAGRGEEAHLAAIREAIDAARAHAARVAART